MNKMLPYGHDSRIIDDITERFIMIIGIKLKSYTSSKNWVFSVFILFGFAWPFIISVNVKFTMKKNNIYAFHYTVYISIEIMYMLTTKTTQTYPNYALPGRRLGVTLFTMYKSIFRNHFGIIYRRKYKETILMR